MRITSGRKALLLALAVSSAAALSGCAGDDGDSQGANYGYAGPGVYDPFYDRYYDYDRVYYPDRHHRHPHDRDAHHDRAARWQHDRDGDRDRDGRRNARWQDGGGRSDGVDRGGDRNRARDGDRSGSREGSRIHRSDGGRNLPHTIRQQENIRSGGSSVGGGHAPAPRIAPGGGGPIGREDG